MRVGLLPAPFIWSTDLSGVSLLPSRRRVDWAAGGAALFYFIAAQKAIAGAQTAIIAHSHGGNVVLFAAAEQGLKIATLITVGSPVRSDMSETARKARPNIGRWLAIHSDHTDYWQWLGELCSGGFLTREQPLADVNGFAPHVGHSALLRDATTFPYWVTNAWLGWCADRPTASAVSVPGIAPQGPSPKVSS